MKQKSDIIIKAISVLMAFCFAFCVCVNQNAIYAAQPKYDDGYENMSSSQKQAYLTQHLKEVKEKLATLSKQSEETEEYINTLDEKIKYLQMELALAEENIENAKKRIINLEQKYKSNEEEIRQLKKDIEKLANDSALLETEFSQTYGDFCKRARALYISGDMNTISTLLTSEDMSTLFIRLEMIKQVSRSDKQLLESLEEKGNELLETRALLEDKEQNLSSDQETLKATRSELSETVVQLEAKQTDFEAKEQAYKQEKAKSDKLLSDLHKKTKTYSEFKNQDQKELQEVNREIEAAAEEFLKQMEEREKATSTTKPTTTKKPTTTRKPTTTTTTTTTQVDEPSQEDSTTSTTKKPTTTTTTTTTTKPTTTKKTTTKVSNKLSMTFPIPSQTKITTGYGSAGYAGHTGVDFACPTGSKVVAAESGYVIISKDLTNSNGTYRSYGRYIVIAHDKKNSSGNYVYTLYAHNSSRVVSEGEYVTKGQLIAYSGSTGNSTGPHCHFEVRTPTASYDDCVDPTRYLP